MKNTDWELVAIVFAFSAVASVSIFSLCLHAIKSAELDHQEVITAMEHGYVQQAVDRRPWVVWVKEGRQ